MLKAGLIIDTLLMAKTTKSFTRCEFLALQISISESSSAWYACETSIFQLYDVPEEVLA